jgi:hypothetical protein
MESGYRVHGDPGRVVGVLTPTRTRGEEHDLMLTGYPGAPKLRRTVLSANERLCMQLRDAEFLLVDAERIGGQDGKDHPESFVPEK